MADGKENDPLAPWRDVLSQWETSVNALANRTMKTDEYASSMHGAMGSTLKMQELIRDAMAQYLAATNLPSRAEVLAIAERMGAMETRLERMTALLEQIAAAQTNAGSATGSAPAPPQAPARARPPRTKSPPAAEPTA